MKMKKLFTFIFFIIVTCNSFCQSSINVYVKDYCNVSETRLQGEIVDKYGNIEVLSSDSATLLSSQDRYFITGVYYRVGKLKIICFDMQVNNREETKVVEIFKIDDFFSGNSVWFPIKYYNCDNLCDGHCVDYYTNGRIRLKGKFKAGLPIGKLFYHNEDGTIEKVEKYNKKGLLIKPNA